MKQERACDPWSFIESPEASSHAGNGEGPRVSDRHSKAISQHTLRWRGRNEHQSIKLQFRRCQLCNQSTHRVSDEYANGFPTTKNGDHVGDVVLDAPALELLNAFAEPVSSQVQCRCLNPQVRKRCQNRSPNVCCARRAVDQENPRAITGRANRKSRLTFG